MKKNKVWAEIKEKKTKRLIRIIYNPYNKPRKDIIKDWIVPEAQKDCYVVLTDGRF